MRRKQVTIALAAVMSLLFAGCGPSEREVELNDEIAALTTQRDEARAELDAVSGELDELKATPVGRLCVARLVVPADGVAEADDAALEQADGLYAQLVADYPDEAFHEEAASTYSTIREERCLRALAPYEGFHDGIKDAKDKELKQAETELAEIGSNFEDTKTVREVDKLLSAIDKEWDRRGRPVSGPSFVADATKHAGQVIRIKGKLSSFEGGPYYNRFYQTVYGGIQFGFNDTDKAATWLDGEWYGVEFATDFERFLEFIELANRGRSGEIVLYVNDDGSFQTRRIIIGNEVFEF